MRIAVVSDLVRPNGAGVMALLAADILTAAGHEVVVFGGAMPHDLERQLSSAHYGAAAFTNDESALDRGIDTSSHAAFLAALRSWFDQEVATHDPDPVSYTHLTLPTTPYV